MESAELIAILQEVRERVQARNPQALAGEPNAAVADLMPLVHARDAALGKVAAIGTVNPRRGGVVNALVQRWKKLVSRALDWHVREQVEFNRKMVACIDASLEALNETNRALHELGGRIEVAEELKDIRNHWIDWRAEWEQKLRDNEIQFLRSVAELQGAFQHRVTLMDAGHREAMLGQHAAFTAELERTGAEIQRKLWADMERFRTEYERIIHSELRAIRQRTSAAAPHVEPPAAKATPARLPFDYGKFAEKFRGSEEYVKAGQRIYLPYFSGRRDILDLGCGRGEFLELMRDAGTTARGIDSSEESVAACRAKGLNAERADLFEYLAALPEVSLDGIFCSQVIEHLPPDRLPELVKLCASRLAKDGVLIMETPNPECLAIFATHFYLDPTHTRPIPPPLLTFYMEEFGLGRLEVKRLSPAIESIPAVASLPQDFRDVFFGPLDYAAIGKKL